MTAFPKTIKMLSIYTRTRNAAQGAIFKGDPTSFELFRLLGECQARVVWEFLRELDPVDLESEIKYNLQMMTLDRLDPEIIAKLLYVTGELKS